MIDRHVKYYSRIIVAGFFYLMYTAGCISTVTHTQKQILDYNIPVEDAVDKEFAAALESAEYDTSVLHVPDYLSILSLAGKACAGSAFSTADSLYRYILPGLIESADEDTLREAYLSEIIEIYATVIPDSIAAPEEITFKVFQQQMMHSFDTIPFSTNDTLMVSRLVKRPDVKHDIPIVWNERVEKALMYYITHSDHTVKYWKKRAPRYLSFMKKMFADSTLPQDLAYLPLIESGFNPRAYSRAHASGIWQFISSTGRMYGLRNSYWVDERRDPIKATNAAIRYLKKLYNEFGHWYLALAAYNCGENGLRRNIKRCGTDNYWQLRLPRETMNYVPFYLAALTIAKDSLFADMQEQLSDTIPFDTVNINECIDMREIADGINVPFDTLRALNPHILHWCTPPDMSEVTFYLPSGKAAAFSKFCDSLPDERKVSWKRYRVRSGDNLGSIARRFNISIRAIKSVNKIRKNRIYAGKHLFIPLPSHATKSEKAARSAVAVVPENAKHIIYEVKRGDTIWRLAELFDVSCKQIRTWNHLSGNVIKAGQIVSIYTTATTSYKKVARNNVKNADRSLYKHGLQKYIVASGDTYSQIAVMFSMNLKDLYSVNGIRSHRTKLYVGDTLLVKNVGGEVLSRGKSGCIRYIVSPGDNLYTIAKNFSISVRDICRKNGITQSNVLSIGDTLLIPTRTDALILNRRHEKEMFYTVKNGDNLWRIAQLVGIPIQRLYEYNGLQANSVIMPGDTIRIRRRNDL